MAEPGPALSTVPEPDANVIIDATSNSSRLERLRVRFDGTLAMDVALPGSCSEHPPVFSFGFVLDPGPTTIEVEVGDELVEQNLVVPQSGTRWIVLQLQPPYPLDADVFGAEPMWG